MAIYKIPPSSSLQDGQFIAVQGPDGIFSGFQFDAETKALYIKDAQVIHPSFHGSTHISEDPVPVATLDLPGLMSADDKVKLESLVQTKIGVLGFQGAGFAEDGGWLEGPIIFASGSELLSIERMGNVVRFAVDSPIPLNCDCEGCAQIFWISDESEVSSIRPPSCGGKMPGVNAYGEMKIYLFPESTILDQNNPTATLNQKDQFPAMIFKRYDNNTAFSGQLEIVLRRNSNLTSNVGFSMTPGAQNTTTAETIWFTGSDEEGKTITFEFEPNKNPGMIGALLYNGHTLTRRMGIITGRDPTVVNTNLYNIKYWDIPNATAIGDEFSATNIWQYDMSTTSPSLTADSTVKLLEPGKLVQLWEFNINNTSLVRRYFSDEPRLDPSVIWTHTDAIIFGDTFDAREETNSPFPGGDTRVVTDLRVFERSNWGIVGFPDPLFYKADTDDFVNGPFNNVFTANIDYDLPGLSIEETTDITASSVGERYERPIHLWNRTNHGNFYAKVLIGQPDNSLYPPIDILFRSKIDSFEDIYISIKSIGNVGSRFYVVVDGSNWNDIPERGTVRFLTKNRDLIWKYDQKAFTDSVDGSVMLVSEDPLPETSSGTIEPDMEELSLGVIVHEDYDTYCCRLEFMVDDTPGSQSVQLQFRVGILDMNTPYEFDETGINDNLIKGFRSGSYSVSRWFIQNGIWTGPGTTAGDPTNFVVFPGGMTGDAEQWNKLEIMCRDNELWLWWNDLIITPDPAENASILPAPVVDVSNPYFDISGSELFGIPAAPSLGKIGFRLWPGAKIRTINIRDQAIKHNEMSHGQLEIID